ncbi:BMP family lipoprotein [Fusibacter sp. JL298sf-3]
MKKRVLSLLLILVLVVGLTACGESAEKESDKTRVAIVFSGNLGDKSYNDSCYEGALKAKDEFDIELKTLEGTEAAEWEANFLAVAEEGYDLIICSSSNFEEYMKEHCANYPETKFAVIDTTVEGDNIVSVSFAQNQGSFLAGAAAALFTKKSNIEGINDDNIIGWVGGMDIPVLHDFYIGYEQGAKYIDPEITVLQSFAGTWNDPLKGKELTLAQYQQGADVVMNVASGTGTGILEAAAEAGKYAIGVDLNQDADQPGAVLTSMLKRVDTACYILIKSVVEGTFEGGSKQYLTLEDNGVSLTDMSVIKEHLGDDFPEDILNEIEALKAKIVSGEIVVENYDGFGPNQ